ncbi:uncharacterized protein LOC112086711 [Eutrema salsugineum]|uniref:uncharacterized protein LOC112086711 n=1 Tax=Eutrema salsugineum TaxID=72664 RepID=UPI000CECEDC5|nr:uncharacterized protein LOC112086711 [Eutrema salsugineum]
MAFKPFGKDVGPSMSSKPSPFTTFGTSAPTHPTTTRRQDLLMEYHGVRKLFHVQASLLAAVLITQLNASVFYNRKYSSRNLWLRFRGLRSFTRLDKFLDFILWFKLYRL